MTMEEKLALVGTEVRIRTWDSLAEEYGVGVSGSIHVDEIEMLPGPMANTLCGKCFVIKTISEAGNFIVSGPRFIVSEHMLDFNYPNEDEVWEIDVASKNELDSFLSWRKVRSYE